MSSEQLNRELTDLVARTRRLLAHVDADLPRMEAEETEALVVPFDPPHNARQQTALAEAG
jgi:hypothetical protein